jgi:hypothetical protein
MSSSAYDPSRPLIRVSLHDHLLRSEPPVGDLQLHELTAAPVTYWCPRCGWHGYVWQVATVGGKWDEAVCERCYEDLHPEITTATFYWSVSEFGCNVTTPEDRLPFTVIRSRRSYGSQGARRDEMYRPHLSHDGDVWEFTSVLAEEARDGSNYNVKKITEAEAHAIMDRVRHGGRA